MVRCLMPIVHCLYKLVHTSPSKLCPFTAVGGGNTYLIQLNEVIHHFSRYITNVTSKYYAYTTVCIISRLRFGLS